ncbi:hypothetical protein EON65_29505 [archaeon]|nr:MAG: hypothetical protein EON65_29505 [archaeon]
MSCVLCREKLQKEVDIDRLFNAKRKKKVKSDKGASLKKYFHDSEPIKTKSLQDIMKDAKISSGLARDKRKTEEESKKYGQLRRICPELIEEIKQEFSVQQTEMEMQKTANDPGRNTMLASMRLARPRSAQITLSNRGENTAEVIRGRVRPSTASSVRSSGLRAERGCDSSERPAAVVSAFSEDNNGNSDENDDENNQLMPAIRRPSALARTNSTGMFNVKSIHDDERIMKALLLKEKLAKEKEDQLKKKILDREQSQVLKQEYLTLLEKKKAWLILGIVLKYVGCVFVCLFFSYICLYILDMCLQLPIL